MFWETQDDIPSLGAVSFGSSGQIDVDLPDENEVYEQVLHVLGEAAANKPNPKGKQVVDARQQEANYYRKFRTMFVHLALLLPNFSRKIRRVLLFWVLTNGLLAVAMTGPLTSAATTGTNTVPGYLTFLLYSMVSLSCKSSYHLHPLRHVDEKEKQS